MKCNVWRLAVRYDLYYRSLSVKGLSSEILSTLVFPFIIPSVYNYNISVNTTKFYFYIQWYIYQGDMFRPSRSTSSPTRNVALANIP
jgi:hypothetical protein